MGPHCGAGGTLPCSSTRFKQSMRNLVRAKETFDGHGIPCASVLVLTSPAKKDMSSEQRRTPRINVDLPARYRSEGVSLDGRAWDISQDGMFFMSPFLDDTPGEINLELDL